MTNHTSITHYLFIALLLTTPALYTQETEQLTQEQKEENLKKHFGAHLVTGIAPFLCTGASFISTQAIANAVMNSLGVQNSKVISAVNSLSVCVNTLGGLFVMYNTPQWTDTYLLNKKKKRTDSKTSSSFFTDGSSHGQSEPLPGNTLT